MLILCLFEFWMWTEEKMENTTPYFSFFFSFFFKYIFRNGDGVIVFLFIFLLFSVFAHKSSLP